MIHAWVIGRTQRFLAFQTISLNMTVLIGKYDIVSHMFEKDQRSLFNKLERIGLSEKEIKVYSHLLDSGGATPSEIAYATHVARPTVYRILLELSIKGLVHEIKKSNKKFFYIDSSRDLLKWKRDQAKLVSEQTQFAEKQVEFLDAILKANTGNIDVRYFNDVEGLRSIYEDHLNYSNYEMMGFSHIESIEGFLGRDFLRSYIRTKTKNNITTKGILPASNYSDTYADNFYHPISDRPNLQLRFASTDDYPLHFESEIILYGDSKLSIVNVKNEILSGLIIENEGLYNMFKSIFYMAWHYLENKRK